MLPLLIQSVASFSSFFVIVLENTDYTAAARDTYLGTTLPSKGRLLTNYYAINHPSQPNYLSMISGKKYSVGDGNVNFGDKNIVDLLEANGKTWKVYQDKMPSACYTKTASPYVRKHNPFISMTNIASNSARCSKIVPATQLQTDISKGSLANYIFYTPDMNNDGHDTSVTYASKWLKDFLEPLLSNSLFNDTLFVVTFDEDAYGGNNRVLTVLLGAGVQPGTTDATNYNHYSQLATVEKQFGLGNLGQNDATATPFKLA
ncbi:phosphoesterase family-domain-containing protein [Gorgonomyces haynaldii]|nr:phosphoesterase family-domain-containing protein [Gorgonomyces haynaldii]